VLFRSDGKGDGDYVTSLYVREIGEILTFVGPDAGPQATEADTSTVAHQDGASSGSVSSDSSLFAISNPHNQSFPVSEAQALYLSACKVVEQEFSQVDPVRPQLALLLGADADRVSYPKREIQLTKWNKYQFTQGVLLLAMDDLMPRDKRLSLTQLAVSEAEATVDLSSLRGSRAQLHVAPRN
jgi:hypothetical protein